MDMLPPGVTQHTFDITIQAPGVAVFTAPAIIKFPNVFNAAPGTKLQVLSFDHTTGKLVFDGYATVSADGDLRDQRSGSGRDHAGLAWPGAAWARRRPATTRPAWTRPGTWARGPARALGQDQMDRMARRRIRGVRRTIRTTAPTIRTIRHTGRSAAGNPQRSAGR